MTHPPKMRRGLALQAYLLMSYGIVWLAPMVLRKRLARGKEHPERWPEKMGLSLAPRPEGPLVWLHAVGLGEVMSLRGLIAQMSAARPDMSFLVTSTTAASSAVFDRQMPPCTTHQFLPLDAPAYRQRFLDHFQPDLCIWVEQDLWPGFVSDLAARGTPQAIVAARMNATSFKSHQRASSLFRNLYGVMGLVTAQDDIAAGNLRALGADPKVTGSLKPAAPALTHDVGDITTLQVALQNRFVWAAAPAHPTDVTIAEEAHAAVRAIHPDALLIIAPRFPDRFAGRTLPRRSLGQSPQPHDAIWLCDTFGDLGLVYRLCAAALIGGTFDDTEGHNPWEAAALKTAILHGPRTANFAADFAQLDAAGAAIKVDDAKALATALTSADLTQSNAHAKACINAATTRTDALATELLALLGTSDDR